MHDTPDSEVGSTFVELIGLIVDGVFEIVVIDRSSEPTSQSEPVFAEIDILQR